MKVIAIYDNEGKTMDRYTVYYNVKETNDMYMCLGMSEKPFNPLGFGQHSCGQLGSHNGKKITFNDLPVDCQKAVTQDMN